MKRTASVWLFALVLSAIPLATGLAQSWNPKEPINGFSKDSLYRSIRAITSSMNGEERVIFRRGFNDLMVRRFPLTAGMEGDEARVFLPMAMEAAHVTMDGLSVGEVMTLGTQLQRLATEEAAKAPPLETNPIKVIAAFDRKEEERAQQETVHLAKVRACLTEKLPLKVAYVRKGKVFDDLELTFTNALDWPLSYVAFGYEITSEGRKIPYSEREVSRTMRDGLQPGETRLVRMTVSAIPQDVDVSGLDIRVNLLNVGDMAGKSLLNKPKSLLVGGLSDKECK